MKFVIAKWKLGHLLALYTTQGLRKVLLGSRPADLISILHQAFPKAQKASSNDAVYSAMQGLIHYAHTLKGNYPGHLDRQGTPFQIAVWRVLETIPFGNTMSYLQIAKHLRNPNAYRAVANACGANPIPLIIPCHRVVGEKSMGGYRFGVKLKNALLEWERPCNIV